MTDPTGDHHLHARGDCSVMADDLVLAIADPPEAFKRDSRAFHAQILRPPFLLSFTSTLKRQTRTEAKEAAEEPVGEPPNMLAFITGSGFRKQGIRQIVDAEGASTSL